MQVSVPCSGLLTTVRVRCGHCTNLFTVNVKGLLLSQVNHFQPSQRNLLDELSRPSSSFLMDLATMSNTSTSSNNIVNANSSSSNIIKLPFNRGIEDELGRMPAVRLLLLNNVPSLTFSFLIFYNKWAHFPHIHFGLMPDEDVKRTSLQQQQQNGDNVTHKEEFYRETATDNMGGSLISRVSQFPAL
ncbi:protein YABBY 4 isoform X1 [Canna indica]|uniref:Protein YABBY 4 isoform X1 n=1 Tax=Canna indica TaxID=4628 RepID=A0AAQ3KBD9_9LILI|nr:protein YABBY 4 isoform X1 [Canna indica]